MRVRYQPAGSKDTLAKLSWPAVLRLLKLAAPYKGPLIVGGVLLLMASAVNLSLPLFARQALNSVLATRSLDQLDRLALIVGGLIVLSAGLSFAQYVLVAFAGNRIVTDIRSRLYGHLLSLPVSFFDRTRSGDLASHLSSDVTLIQQTLTSDVVSLMSNVVTLVGGTILAISLQWQLSLVVVSLLAVVMLFFVVFGRQLRKLTRGALDALSEAIGSMSEALANVRLVKAFARESHEQTRADERLQKVLAMNNRASISEGLMGAVGFSGFTLLLLGVIWYGGRAVLGGSMSAGSLLAFFMTVTLISGPMGSLASLYTRLQRAVGAADRIFELLDEQPESADSPLASGFPDGPAEVLFERVEFAYVPETPVLAGLNLELPAGRVTALVGASGAGKSTVAALLYRFYEPQAGSIRIDGVAINTIRRADLRQAIGIVPQDPLLFNGTLKENIKYGRLEASDAEVEHAAEVANVAEFAATMPDGYETLLGERGVKLSGGQRQRVAIARAVLKDPRILILDEATSALDARSETLVREALERLTAGRTTLVIAHRLTTIQKADAIAVLDDGRIVELGTHGELLRRGGRYAELQDLLRQQSLETETPA